MTMLIAITPVPKPRMTQRDKWAKRPAVLRYRAFADELRLQLNGWNIPPFGLHLTFHVQMPPSWSKKKRSAMDGQPHQQKPDVDNYLKAFMDAVEADDAYVWDVRATKRWSTAPGIEITQEVSHV